MFFSDSASLPEFTRVSSAGKEVPVIPCKIGLATSEGPESSPPVVWGRVVLSLAFALEPLFELASMACLASASTAAPNDSGFSLVSFLVIGLLCSSSWIFAQFGLS